MMMSRDCQGDEVAGDDEDDDDDDNQGSGIMKYGSAAGR